MQDGLVLWLDGKAQRQLMKMGQSKIVWKDLSGNGNDGKLMNFDFTKDSGWVDGGLKFDGVDDYVLLPDLDLNPDNFTIQVNDKIRAFNGDKVITENGDEWGRNLLRNASFNNNAEGWSKSSAVEIVDDITINSNHSAKILAEGFDANKYTNITLNNIDLSLFEEGETYTYSLWAYTPDKSGIQGGTEVGLVMYKEGEVTDWNNEKINFIDNKWVEVSKTFTFREGCTRANFRMNVVKNGTVYYSSPKVEKGSTATPWTPAPEDLTKINTIDHNSYLVENNTIHTLKLYNRALTDEEIMQNYRATHFLLEPKTFTSTNYYSFYDLNRVENNTIAVKDLVEVLRGEVNLGEIDIDRDMKSIPFAEVLNKVEGNINILGNKLYKPKEFIQPKLDWRYNQSFSYEDANRLERNLLLLYNYAKGNIDKIPHCGMISVGEEVI